MRKAAVNLLVFESEEHIDMGRRPVHLWCMRGPSKHGVVETAWAQNRKRSYPGS